MKYEKGLKLKSVITNFETDAKQVDRKMEETEMAR
jgi:hypothetical protein